MSALKSIAVALAAAFAASAGTALGELARDRIRARFAPPTPVPAARRKRGSRR